jgi:sulfoxide reductase heme-binding subunit YedZ
MSAKKSLHLGPFKVTPLQLIVHVSAWLLLAVLVIQAVLGDLSVNPVELAEQRTGRYAIYFLIFSLACTPINIIFGFRQVIKVRGTFGLYSFLLAVIHLSIFTGIDYGFNFQLLLSDVGTKKYILAGAVTMAILIPLAVTSFDWWKRKLKKNWKRLHMLVYIAGITALLHFAWARKGDLFSLQGNIIEPVILAFVVIFLLLVRINPVKRRIIALREHINQSRHLSAR